jgi:hypothetical protein
MSPNRVREERGEDPDRGSLARQLLGAGKKHSPERVAVEELVEERESDERLSTDREL